MSARAGARADGSFFELSDEGARAKWGRLVKASVQATVFADLAVAEAVGAAFGLPVRIAAVEDASGDFAAGLLVFEKRRGPYRAAALPPLVPVSSPLLATPLAEADTHARRSPLDHLLALVGSEVHQATLALHPSLGDARSFTWAGWRVAPRYSYTLDLTTEDVTAGWSTAARRTARTEGAAFVVEEDPRHAEAAVALMEASYVRGGARPGARLGLDGAAVRALARTVVEAGRARVFAAIPTGGSGPDAAIITAHDGRTAHYWIGGSVPGPAMTVLLGTVLAWLAAEGIARFDFVGANTPSIAEFKRRFGPALTLAFRARLVTRPELRLLDGLAGR